LWFGWPAWNRISTLEKWLVCGWVAILAGAALSFLHTDDIRSGRRDLEKFLRFAVAGPLYLTLRRYEWSMTKAVLAGSLIGGPILLLFGVIQVFFQEADRAHGVVYPITYGDITILFAMIIFVSGGCLYKRKRDLLWIALGFGGLTAAILSKTRNSFLVLPALILILPFALRRRVPWKIHLFLYGGGFILLLGTWIGAPKIRERMAEGNQNIEAWYQGEEGSIDTSMGSRLSMWQRSLQLWETHPLIGIGIGDYPHEMRALLEKYPEEKAIIGKYGHAHSNYIHIATTQGAVGLLLHIMILLGIPFLIGWKSLRNAKERSDLWPGVGTCTIVICWAVFGIGETWTAKNGFLSVYLLTLVPFLAASGQILENEQSISKEAPAHA
ncbi:MAG: O-antigen ligase family protein, partial [Planctomycetota bacterium]|nr:O-antigen ligase family protein [Planctomycetota bacterium]